MGQVRIEESALEQDTDEGFCYSRTMNWHNIRQGDLKDLLQVTSQGKSATFKRDRKEAMSNQKEAG